jgi:hypothetical protein
MVRRHDVAAAWLACGLIAALALGITSEIPSGEDSPNLLATSAVDIPGSTSNPDARIRAVRANLKTRLPPSCPPVLAGRPSGKHG